MDQYLKNDVLTIQKSIVDHVEYTIARSRFKFDDFKAYKATANNVRDRLLESWNDIQQFYRDHDLKRVYYFPMEFLMGRSLQNSLFDMGLKDQYAEALSELGYNLEDRDGICGAWRRRESTCGAGMLKLPNRDIHLPPCECHCLLRRKTCDEV